MPRSECKRTAVCATSCRSRASKNSVPCRLSIRRNVQTVSIATTLLLTHNCYTNHLLLNRKNILLYCGDSFCPQRQIAGGIQVCYLQFILADQGKDRTCLSEDKRVLQCPCPTLTIPDLLYTVELSVLLFIAAPHT